MRVVAGIAKGRALKLDRRGGIRPTSDKLKEALFSTLGTAVQGRKVLDLFAGSGALGIEALSRGAESATFVDSSRSAALSIRQNLEATGFTRNAVVIHRKVERFVAEAPAERFGLVLMDPPYADGLPSEVLLRLREGGFLESGALVVIEVSSRLRPVEPPDGFQLDGHRRYGDSALLYLSSE